MSLDSTNKTIEGTVDLRILLVKKNLITEEEAEYLTETQAWLLLIGEDPLESISPSEYNVKSEY